MIPDKASWTAEITAVFRAVESIRPSRERLLHDIYADKFLRPTFRLLLKSKLMAKFALWIAIDRRFPGATDTTVSRMRFIDDFLSRSITGGIEQLVILGAGYDSRAYRFPELRQIKVFEVDHPDTQVLKKRKILNMFGMLPRHIAYVPVNFERNQLIPKLTHAGYCRDLKTLFIWEGVCKYLSADAVDQLLISVALNACKGSSIVFDYLFQSMVNGTSGSKLAHKMLHFQARKGEPFIFGLPEQFPEEHITAKGFSHAKNITAAMIKEIYFKKIKRGRKLHPFWGLIEATV